MSPAVSYHESITAGQRPIRAEILQLGGFGMTRTENEQCHSVEPAML
jgi:hypothetical protein